MSFWQDFKNFAVKGNVIDLAIGVVIGGAFGQITNSLVSDIIMPPLGLIIGKVDFKNLRFVLKPGDTPQTLVAINYGNFVQICINFLIVAFALFLMIRVISRLKTLQKHQEQQETAAAVAAAQPPPPPELSRQEELLTEIRDLLKTKSS